MVDSDTIEPVQKPTDYGSWKTNGKLRLCLDSRPLNKAIKPEHPHHPTAEEIFQISGASYYSKLVASSGFWQMKVDEQGSDLLAFGNPSGWYRFKCSPYGIHAASEII